MTYKLRLADGQEIGIGGYGTPFFTVVSYETRAAAVDDWAKLIPEALKAVSIIETETNAVLSAYANVVLDSVSFTVNPDNGRVTAKFNFHGEAVGEASADDADYIEAAKILLGEVE